VACAIFLPVYFKVLKPRSRNDAVVEIVPVTSGGNGSQVVMEDGTEFLYFNPFGGFCTASSSSPQYCLLTFLSLPTSSSFFILQGCTTQTTRSIPVPSRTRGRLLSTHPGISRLTKSTGAQSPCSHLLLVLLTSLIQCQPRRPFHPGAYDLTRHLRAISWYCGRMGSLCGDGRRPVERRA
jgi:hypothetical protein